MRFSANATAKLAPTGLRNFPRPSFSSLGGWFPLAVLYFSTQLLLMRLQYRQISGEPRSRRTAKTNSECRFLRHSEWLVSELPEGRTSLGCSDGCGPGGSRALFKALPVSSAVLSPACRP